MILVKDLTVPMKQKNGESRQRPQNVQLVVMPAQRFHGNLDQRRSRQSDNSFDNSSVLEVYERKGGKLILLSRQSRGDSGWVVEDFVFNLRQA